jgi:hypothetical protein
VPPVPTVIGTVPPGVTGKLVAKTTPPAPPPAPDPAPPVPPAPPPPAATNNTSTDVTPEGTLNVAGPVDVKYESTAPGLSDVVPPATCRDSISFIVRLVSVAIIYPLIRLFLVLMI